MRRFDRMHKESGEIIMKRIGRVWHEICEYDNIVIAHRNASSGKRWYKEVKRMDADLDNHVLDLQLDLLFGTYKTSEYVKDTKKENEKMRNIYKLPYYPDRVAQWSVLQVVDKYFINTLIDQTYSAIPGRGIHMALKHIRRDMRSDPEGTKYCLKLDVRKYYESINHGILKKKLSKLFKDKCLLDFFYEIIDSISTNETLPNTGIPIGNYASQYFGNYYLSDFDHWMKEEKKCKYYYRYMDDIVILSDSKEWLHQLRKEIDNFLSTEKLQIKGNWQVFPVEARGIDFVGYVIYHDYVLLRKNTKKNMCRKMREIRKMRKEDIGLAEFSSFHSYAGWLIPCNGYRLYQKHLQPLRKPIRDYYFEVIKGWKTSDS